MAKVWEETWEHRGGSAVYGPGNEQVFQSVTLTDDEDDPLVEENRARLAAAAPEMARLLWDWARGGHEWECPSCEHDLFSAARNDPLGELPLFHAEAHEPDCGLVALLRKAGVLE